MNMHKLCPILWTKDLQATIDFYTTVLRFTARSNFPNFVSLSKENAEIMFVVPQAEPDDKGFFPAPLLTGSIYIFMDNVDEFWSEVKDKVKIKSAIKDREYFMRDFSIFDNNGYEIVFGEDISNSAPNS